MKYIITIMLCAFLMSCHDSTVSTSVEPTVIYKIETVDALMSIYSYKGYNLNSTWDGIGYFKDSSYKFKVGDTIKIVKQ